MEASSVLPPAPALYPGLLGARYAALAPELAEFHRTGEHAQGTLAIERGPRAIARLLCRLLRVPAPGPALATLAITRDGPRERWSRVIGGRRLDTTQSARAGLLIERIAPFTLAFRLSVADGALVFEQASFRFVGIPVPRPFAPRVSAIARAADIGWTIDVRVDLPFVGLLCRYSGTMTSA